MDLPTAIKGHFRLQLVIFTDSLTQVKFDLPSEESGHTTNRPSLLRQQYEVLYNSHHDISHALIPAHVGVRGNELADHLAKEGTMKANVEIDTELEIIEMCSQICNYCEEKWQTEWSQVFSDQFHIIHSSIKTSKQPRHTNRRLAYISHHKQTEIW